jgi:GT2 family glycosyltransferase
LADTLESVLSQTYDNWEACIVDAGSEQSVKEVLQEFARRDKRVRVRFLGKNLGISRNSNIAIERASGEFIALLDHDDLLAPFALFEVVESLNKMPELDFIYSDRDSATLEGKRSNPLFKPDWSPDVMLSANYLAQLCVIRTRLAKSLGGFRPETDGAQDWDLFLRATERTTKIHHIPKILYHWRQAPASVSATGFYAKPYAPRAQILAVDEHLARNGRRAEVSLDRSGFLRVSWKLVDRPLISIIIHCQEGGPLFQRCLDAVVNRSSYKNIEVVVCAKLRPEALERHRQKVHMRFVECGQHMSYAEANNMGANQALGEVLVFLDEHAEVVSPRWLEELGGWALQPEVSVVGAKLLAPDRTIYHGGVVIGLPGYVFEGAHERSWLALGHTEWYRNYTAVSGACLASRSSVFRELGRFNSRLNMGADIDLCLCARKHNYRVVYTPHARLILYRPEPLVLRKSDLFAIPEFRQTVERGDPYFNRNLSYEHTVPTLKQR